MFAHTDLYTDPRMDKPEAKENVKNRCINNKQSWSKFFHTLTVVKWRVTWYDAIQRKCPEPSKLKALSHDANILATCNAILLLRYVN